MQQNEHERDGGGDRVPLVVLAAGAGSRFRGEKPLAVVGPDGESLLDYTIFDALRIGFDPVLVVSDRNHRDVEAHLAERHDARRLRYVVQGQGSALPQRSKPWGTVHAVLSASTLLTGPFAVANADDFYGYEAVRSLADALVGSSDRGEDDVDHLISYPWRSTMPPSGTANRGVCTVDSAGRLVGIDERRDLTAESQLAADDQVSMNLWGFGRSAIGALEQQLEEFVRSHHDDPNAELTIPDAMSRLIRDGRTVLVHPTGERWIGVTYPDDVEWARDRIRELLSEGTYPVRLGVSR